MNISIFLATFYSSFLVCIRYALHWHLGVCYPCLGEYRAEPLSVIILLYVLEASI